MATHAHSIACLIKLPEAISFPATSNFVKTIKSSKTINKASYECCLLIVGSEATICGNFLNDAAKVLCKGQYLIGEMLGEFVLDPAAVVENLFHDFSGVGEVDLGRFQVVFWAAS